MPQKNMRAAFLAAVCLALVLLTVSCNKRLTDATEEVSGTFITAFGEDNTLEVVSWNIEMFPIMRSRTISAVKRIILALDADIYAVEEITSDNDFQTLIDSLNAADSLVQYSGRLNPLAPSLKTGIIYKSGLIEVLSDTQLVAGDNRYAQRPPLIFYLRASRNGRSFDFSLMVVHLKAFGDADSEDRRRRAVQSIEQFVNDQLSDPEKDHDFIIAGDWNDLLNDDPAHNIFLPFLNNPQQYRFLTAQFAGSPTEFTFIGGSFNSLIDHIMITSSVDGAFPSITTRILKIDQEFTPYLNEVSDHRPVAAKFPAF